MGLGLYFAEGEGPALRAHRCATRRRSRALAVPDMAKLRYVFDAVREIKRALGGRVPLIGFAGSPFTLACYMIEGGGSADFATVRKMAYAGPTCCSRLVDVNARAVAAYLNEQIEAGADAVMIFDTWGGLLSAAAYRALSLASDAHGAGGARARARRRRVPTIVFTKGGGQWLDDLAACGASCVGLDWTVDIARRAPARRQRASRCRAISTRWCCSTDPAIVDREARGDRPRGGPAPGHIFNLGHGIVPATPPENVAALVEAVHRESRAARSGA